MTWEQYAKDQEQIAFGQFLLHTIAVAMGTKPAPAAINRAVFKSTECGAWIKFDEQGILVGTIVEGSDAEFSTRIELEGIDIDEAGAGLLRQRFLSALEECENFANEHWERL
jgi:hypothetical protein